PLLVGLFFVLVALGARDHGASETELLAGFGLALLQGAALWRRRERPELALAGALAGGLGILLLYPGEEILLPVAGFFAIAALAAARPPRISLVGLAALIGLVLANLTESSLEDVLFTVGLSIGSWAIGEASRNRRVALAEAARSAVAAEQARIARELHDVIAHSVSVIVVQAAAADDVFERRPQEAHAALRAIERTARDALGELRRLLGAVRPEDDPGPAPGLARIEELATPLRAAGLQVVVRREGPAVALPAGLDVSAYRIVQEALTNTLRHAQASRADVTLRYGDDAVEVEVTDDGRGDGDASGGGNGLVGMRERAALLGGRLEAGPLPQRGYRVHARLPL
ncbi:MAG TPA: sensor histidine kinase, partial [Solirubrobacteraceae bacterium]